MHVWRDQRTVVTGGAGFLGSVLVRKLRDRGCRSLWVPRSRDYDLVHMEAVERLYREAKPDIVFHLAARVGGIGANQAQPGRFFFENLMMGAQLMEGARQHGVQKFVAVGTICAYPKYTPIPFQEETMWDGYPEETNAPYGLAKKMLLVQSQAYRQQYGFNSIVLFPANLYGPGDSFHPDTSHVIPAIIRKCVAAKESGAPSVTLWGDGTPTREFLHVDDAAEGLLLAAERYDRSEPVNLGTGQEISIRELAELIVEDTGFSGVIRFDPDKPNGQPRRCLDVSRAASFGFRATRSLREGIRETVSWFQAHRTSFCELVL